MATQFNPKSLIDPINKAHAAPAPGTWATFYTSPTDTGALGTLIYGLYVVSVGDTSGTTEYSLRHVESGGTAGSEHLLLNARVISETAGPANVFLTGLHLEPGDFLQHAVYDPGLADSVAVHLYGCELDDGTNVSTPTTFTRKSLIDPTDMSIGDNTVYTSPTGSGKRGTRIEGVYFTRVADDTGANGPWVRLFHVESGGTRGDEHPLTSYYDGASIHIRGYTDPLLLGMGIVLNPGDTLDTSFSRGSNNDGEATIRIYGWEMTD